MSCKMSLEEICSMVESSVFDRKSAKIDAKSLAVHLIAFANADGGTLAIGVEDDGKITGKPLCSSENFSLQSTAVLCILETVVVNCGGSAPFCGG